MSRPNRDIRRVDSRISGGQTIPTRPQQGSRPNRLRPPLDTGVTVGHGTTRRRRHIRAKRLAQLQLAGIVVVLLIALVVGWRLAARPGTATGDAVTPDTPSEPPVMQVVAEDRSEPTPFFASYRSLHLYLPVSPQQLAEIGFHQASGDTALHMDSLLPDADMVLAEQDKGTGRPAPVVDAEENGPSLLEGTVLRMWRSNRTGPPDTAVDVCAPVGSPVYAPVTGDVVEVRPYLLYDKYEDYEIHIRPSGWPEVDLVMIHVNDPAVSAGDHIIGGVTQLASVRLLSDRVTPQISAYTNTGGDHVHIQLNEIAPNGSLDGLDGS